MSDPEVQLIADSVAEIAHWLVVECAYPYDFSLMTPPPPELRRAIERAWIERDGLADGTDHDDIRMTVADEGGWSRDHAQSDGYRGDIATEGDAP